MCFMLIAIDDLQQAEMKAPSETLCSVSTASELLQHVQNGETTVNEYVGECLDAIEKYEPDVAAFASIDRDAGPSDAGQGLLQGIPIGVKDVIETARLPTEFNSPLYVNHQAARDAACVAILIAHGAFVLGKTTTVEFASLGQVSATRNPHNLAHTPGGTSSGSAAAVATGMVPIALATQTGGSTIRPASFCGVAALKPTWGLVPVEGLKPYAPSLDTITWMARSVDDLERVLSCFQPTEPDPVLGNTLRIGFYRTPYWDDAETATRDALRKTVDILEAHGVTVEPVDGPENDGELNTAQDTVMHAEGRPAYLAEYLQWPDRLHNDLRDEVENREQISSTQLVEAYDYLAAMRPAMENRMSGFDAWLTPAVPGEAPAGLKSTGDAVFNRLWTGLHMPCVTLPGFRGPQNLPVGIQLVAPRFRDRHLLTVASAIESMIRSA
jgi:Asp-tRNA(Asn)/Glu-tRNA(Gln) amidotransferase A subunit family amidase